MTLSIWSAVEHHSLRHNLSLTLFSSGLSWACVGLIRGTWIVSFISVSFTKPHGKSRANVSQRSESLTSMLKNTRGVWADMTLSTPNTPRDHTPKPSVNTLFSKANVQSNVREFSMNISHVIGLISIYCVVLIVSLFSPIQHFRSDVWDKVDPLRL